MEDGWKVASQARTIKPRWLLTGDVDVLIGPARRHRRRRLATGLQSADRQRPALTAHLGGNSGPHLPPGQSRKVTLILPLTYAEVNGERCRGANRRCNGCGSRNPSPMPVDGVVPEDTCTPAQAFQDVMAWMERLDIGGWSSPDPVSGSAAGHRRGRRGCRRRRYGDFSG